MSNSSNSSSSSGILGQSSEEEEEEENLVIKEEEGNHYYCDGLPQLVMGHVPLLMDRITTKVAFFILMGLALVTVVVVAIVFH